MTTRESVRYAVIAPRSDSLSPVPPCPLRCENRVCFCWLHLPAVHNKPGRADSVTHNFHNDVPCLRVTPVSLPFCWNIAEDSLLGFGVSAPRRNAMCVLFISTQRCHESHQKKGFADGCLSLRCIRKLGSESTPADWCHGNCGSLQPSVASPRSFTLLPPLYVPHFFSFFFWRTPSSS